MITRIIIDNFKSIGHCDVNFERAGYKYLEDMIFKDKLVNPIAFYGTNGSGKSSFLYALQELAYFIIGENQFFKPFTPNMVNVKKSFENKYKNNQRVLDEKEIKELYSDIKSSITLFFEVNEHKYEYCFETAYSGYISKEILKCNNKELFYRNETSFSYKRINSTIEKGLFPLIRILANEKLNDDLIIESYSFLSSIAIIDTNKENYFSKDLIHKNSSDLMIEQSSLVRDILKKYNSFPLYDIKSKITINGLKSIEVNLDLNNGDSIPLLLPDISSGMLNQSVILSVLTKLPKNSVLVIDELENALHPITILNFLDLIKEKQIQLIFSSHNTFILSKLRPDQIFFANWKYGFSEYKKLSDIYPNIREINNIEKMYLSNLFDNEIKE